MCVCGGGGEGWYAFRRLASLSETTDQSELALAAAQAMEWPDNLTRWEMKVPYIHSNSRPIHLKLTALLHGKHTHFSFIHMFVWWSTAEWFLVIPVNALNHWRTVEEHSSFKNHTIKTCERLVVNRMFVPRLLGESIGRRLPVSF